ncbi:MAG: hypothetical protein LIP11_04915 [Clostridiales bacterium]|nr:hypothetical protein [Clostridiales bacterium]
MSSYRKYFSENYIAVEEPANNKKGFRVRYQYAGLWYYWEHRGGVARLKGMLLALVAVNWGIFAFCGSSVVRVNYFAVLEVSALLSVVGLLFETIGILQFVFHRKHVTEHSFRDISDKIKYGSMAQCLLLLVSVVAGLYFLFCAGFSVESLSVLAGYLVCLADSAVVCRLYGKTAFHTEKSEMMRQSGIGEKEERE